MPALAVNIIIVHPWDVVFPWAKALGKTTPLGWTIMMFTLSAGNNCIMFISYAFYVLDLIASFVFGNYDEWTPNINGILQCSCFGNDGLWCLTPLSTIFQLYRGGQFYWCPEETGGPGENHRPVASHWQTLSHNVIHLVLIEIRTHNIRHWLHRYL